MDKNKIIRKLNRNVMLGTDKNTKAMGLAACQAHCIRYHVNSKVFC